MNLNQELVSWRMSLPANIEDIFSNSGMEVKSAMVVTLKPRRAEPPEIHLACPFCKGAAYRGLPDGELIAKCAWDGCGAVITVFLNHRERSYAALAIKRIP